MGLTVQSTIFIQSGMESEVLGLNLNCVQPKVHTFLEMSDKLLSYTSRMLFTRRIEDSYEIELLLE